MMRFFIFLLISITSYVSAQSSPQKDLFVNANELYRSGKYKKAIELYTHLLEYDKVPSAIYFNLGNCNYKLNKVAPAIYNYERALKLDSGNEEAKNNLILANRLTIDRIEFLPKTFWKKTSESLFEKLSFERWGSLAILMSFFGAILFLMYYFGGTSRKKRLFFIGGILAVFFMISFYGIALQQYNQYVNIKYAIIFSKEINVKSEPIDNTKAIFSLHEGTKVRVLDYVDKWCQIKISNGKIGWTLKENLKPL